MAYGSVNADLMTTSDGVSSSGLYGFKNRIINGAMVIDQRNAGASVTPANAQYTLDRWQSVASAASKFSVQQNASAVTPPAGFKNYLGVTSLSAYSVGAGEVFGLLQPIEGFNTADLGFGAAGASTVTLSFWVRSSLTGTFGGSLSNSATNRSYPFSYTISSANTWEYETITIAGDTTGTWIGATNGTGLNVQFSLGTGTSLSGTAGSWAGSFYGSATGATSVVGTNGATFYITGVQLEKGSTATSFDYRPYGTELQLCQRYYYVVVNQAPVGSSVEYASVAFFNASELDGFITFPVSMRTSPTLVQTSGTGYHSVDKAGTALTFSSWGGSARAGPNSALLYLSGLSGWTAGYGSFVLTNNNSAYIAVQAEL